MKALCKQILVEKDPANFHKLMVELNNLLERPTTYPFNNQFTERKPPGADWTALQHALEAATAMPTRPSRIWPGPCVPS
jgi:hypothetical protein